MSVRLPDTQLWGRVSKASSRPGDAVCGISMWGAHGLSAVIEAGISGLWAVGCEAQETRVEGSLKCCCI